MKRIRSKQAGSATTTTIAVVAGLILLVVGGTVLKDVQPQVLQGVDLNLGLTVANIGVMLIAIPVLLKLFIAPLTESIHQRTASLEATFTEAENLKKEMAELRTSYEARLAQTEAEAREQIQAQIREAQSLRSTLMAEASARADELVKKAEIEIEAEKARALAEIRSHVVDLTLNATERLIGQNVDTKTNRKLVDEFIDNVAVTNA
ncbi:MAG TPA: F0F1 ATP synthase subunit B [Fimbriimonadaceae bacterium]|nr:F0F1 ATP synthase subunit B [Fimbriimonadaceae bacterium]